MSISANVGQIEYQAKQYYVHKSYVNVYYAMYKFLEKWLSENIFRNDPSRVFLASDSYAYRRRFELTDTSKDFDSLDFSSLRFPFANYWPQNTGWVPDDRIAAKQAALTYLGIYVGNTRLKVAAGILNIDVTLHFNREDDARLAYEILYFNSFNEHYYETSVNYGTDHTSQNKSSAVIKIPANIEIKSLKFNPEFKESDWLKKQRVFVIKAQFEMRTFIISPPLQPDYTIDSSDTEFLDKYDDGIDFYNIVDDVILNFSNNKLKFETYEAGYTLEDNKYIGTKPFPEEGEFGTVYVDSYFDQVADTSYIDDKGKKHIITPKLNIYVWDGEKYVNPESNIDSLSIRHNGTYEESAIDISRLDFISKVTSTTNTIEWSYGEKTSSEDISKIELHLAGKNDIIEIPSDATSYKLRELNSNSQYYGYIVFYTKDGTSKKFTINFITSKKKTDSNKTLNSLVGFTW